MVVKPELDIEGLLSKFNLSSPYYVKLFCLLVFAGVTNAFYSLNFVFAASDTDYRCKYPTCDGINLPKTPNITLEDHICTRFPVINDNGNCTLENFDRSRVNACDEWVYEDTGTFVGEFNLGCEDWKRTFVGTVHSFGYMIGLLVMGPLADKYKCPWSMETFPLPRFVPGPLSQKTAFPFSAQNQILGRYYNKALGIQYLRIGRKKLIIITGITAALSGLARSIAETYWVYISLELIEALFGDSYSSTFMLGVEMVTKENRVSFITLMTASTSVAGILMALIAWTVPYWRYFLRIIYAPSLLFLLYTFLLDESLRWLLITGRKEEATGIIKSAAKLSSINISDEDLDNIKCEKKAKTVGWISLLKTTVASRKLLLRFMACVCMWITVLFNKYTLLINSVELEGNKYVNFALATSSELPASFALVFLLKKFKRRIPLISSFLLTGMFCIAQSSVPKGHILISTSLFLIGKFMATISYAIVYLYTSELFPTYTRNTMHALCSSFGRTATMAAPQTPLLMRYFYGLPSILVGGLSLITGVIVMLMPDTAEDVLPDTVKEAEAVGVKETNDRENTTRL